MFITWNPRGHFFYYYFRELEKENYFIHDANNEKQKEELFAKVRSGEIRVLLGSTQKMGAGTNVQNKLIALHDLDVPWRPADVEQFRVVRLKHWK